ncbi:MAG: hypothetical protein ACE5FA_06810 [Dehalococcoidia bacterium]
MLVAILGCASVPKVCTVSPIEIEELKSDSRDLDAELAKLRVQQEKAEAELARWQKRLADRQAQPPVLRVELERLKKASGRVEKVEETEKTAKKDPVSKIRIRVPGEKGDG